MIGLDTNVLVRCFVNDDPSQTERARRFIASQCSRDNPGFVNRVTLCEMVWVLARAYGYRGAEIARVIGDLLDSTDIVIEDHEVVRSALKPFERGTAGFADALIGMVNRARGCDATATSDRRAARLAEFVAVP